ncbi:MAG: hypothetical protein PHD35_10935 [Synergistaceae bacterium]|nr:hypothetical protein [Synergistaceae bacterium]
MGKLGASAKERDGLSLAGDLYNFLWRGLGGELLANQEYLPGDGIGTLESSGVVNLHIKKRGEGPIRDLIETYAHFSPPVVGLLLLIFASLVAGFSARDIPFTSSPERTRFSR